MSVEQVFKPPPYLLYTINSVALKASCDIYLAIHIGRHHTKDL
jgi:hypothetical protein